MKIRPKSGAKRRGLFCGACGSEVPFESKWLNHYYQEKIKGVKRWIVSIGFVCPQCITSTSMVLNYSKSQEKTMKKINLYGLYK